MNILYFAHSCTSDWNNGNAHFLRGIAREFQESGHTFTIYEEKDSWSLQGLVSNYGSEYIQSFQKFFPHINVKQYNHEELNIDQLLRNVEVVIIHEWNSIELISKICFYKLNHPNFLLFFHDTHHRSLTNPNQLPTDYFKHFDGALVFGDVIGRIYKEKFKIKNTLTWHEAADISTFFPRTKKFKGDVVWIGNWGDDERTEELNEYLFLPVYESGLACNCYGVRYPKHILEKLTNWNIKYSGWTPNYRVPEIFSNFRLTIHVPRQPYSKILQGIPTIRIFEALACGIPLISAPWIDTENLFTEGKDYLIAHNKKEMKEYIKLVTTDKNFTQSLVNNGLETILKKHTCKIRVKQFLSYYDKLKLTLSTNQIQHYEKI